MATKAEILRDPNSCLNKAKSNEPLFILTAHDLLAPDVIRSWGTLLQMSTVSERSLAKFKQAMADAQAFEAWAKEHGAWVPGDRSQHNEAYKAPPED